MSQSQPKIVSTRIRLRTGRLLWAPQVCWSSLALNSDSSDYYNSYSKYSLDIINMSWYGDRSSLQDVAKGFLITQTRRLLSDQERLSVILFVWAHIHEYWCFTSYIVHQSTIDVRTWRMLGCSRFDINVQYGSACDSTIAQSHESQHHDH